MEAAGLMHCSASLLLGSKKVGLVTGNRSNGLRLKESASVGHSSVFLRGGGEFSSSGSVDVERQSQWHSLHLRAPPSHPVVRQQVSLGQRTTTAPDPTTLLTNTGLLGDVKKLFLEDEEQFALKRKADGIVSDLRGTCIFLVGMMGSGKTTVGKYLAETLGYNFFDSDKLIEDAAGGTTVAQMWREGREEEFRNAESEVLMQLSSMGRLVVATGGGAVVRPQNWGSMRHGITVWLDVPVEALARRVVAVGCESRPLLGQVSQETAYHQALKCLGDLFEQREGYYKSADAAVSVAALARLMGMEDVSGVTPIMLAFQVLEEISNLISSKRMNKQNIVSRKLRM